MEFIEELPMDRDARFSSPDNTNEVNLENAKLLIDNDMSEGRLLNVKVCAE